MTVDQSREQIDRYIVCSDQTMATSTMTASNHFNSSSTSSTANSSQESLELSSRLTQIQLKDRHINSAEAKIPRRQPTIVCEDIADDIDFDEEEEFGAEEGSGVDTVPTHKGVVRSASTASLTVPSVECDQEKRRPPLPTEEQMLIESN